MKRVLLATQVLILAIVMTSCSNTTKTTQEPSSQLTALAQPTPTCTAAEFNGGSNWIKGQLKAFGEAKPDKAYSYASEEFRKKNSLEAFALTIISQYRMLLNLKDYQIVSCDRSQDLYTFKVELTDNDQAHYTMQYLLSFVANRWGVEGASVSFKS